MKYAFTKREKWKQTFIPYQIIRFIILCHKFGCLTRLSILKKPKPLKE
jgi:hypothetical protein